MRVADEEFSFRPRPFSFSSTGVVSQQPKEEDKKVEYGVKTGRITAIRDTYGFIQLEDRTFDTTIIFPLGEVKDAICLHVGYQVSFQLYKQAGQFKVKDVCFCDGQQLLEETKDAYLRQRNEESPEKMLLNLTNFIYPWNQILDQVSISLERQILILDIFDKISARELVLQERYQALIQSYLQSKFLVHPSNLTRLISRLISVYSEEEVELPEFNEFTIEQILHKCIRVLFEVVSYFPAQINLSEELREHLLTMIEIVKSSEQRQWLLIVLELTTPADERRNLKKARDSLIDDHRNICIFPSLSELLDEVSFSPEHLPTNKPIGAFESEKYYLNTCFRLLRADCFGPLSEGIKQLRKLTPRNKQTVVLHTYTNIRLLGAYFRPGGQGIAHCVSFMVASTIHDWESSSRLSYGNLLCLTVDNFENTIFWATVVHRSVEFLRKGIVFLQFREGDAEALQRALYPDNLDLTSNIELCEDDARTVVRQQAGLHITMVESPTFFLAYEPVLRCLQRFKTFSGVSGCVPFSEYLIRCIGSELPPKYLSDPTMQHRAKSSLWHGSDGIDLEESQMKALELALTKRIALIQGPPGTGKTFLGRKIVQAILNSLMMTPISSDGKENTNEVLNSELMQLNNQLNVLFENYEQSKQRANEACKNRESAQEQVRELKFKTNKLKEQRNEMEARIHVHRSRRDQAQATRSMKDWKKMANEEHKEMIWVITEKESVSNDISSLLTSKKFWQAESDKYHQCFVDEKNKQDKVQQEIHEKKKRRDLLEQTVKSPTHNRSSILPNNIDSSSVILVITFKNHSLDEFLEGCLPFCDSIVRIGGRSRSKKLEKCNLKELIKAQREKTASSDVYLLRNTASNIRKRMDLLKAQIQRLQHAIFESLEIKTNNTGVKQKASGLNILRQEQKKNTKTETTSNDVKKQNVSKLIEQLCQLRNLQEKEDKNVFDELSALEKEQAPLSVDDDDDVWLSEEMNERMIDTTFGEGEEEDNWEPNEFLPLVISTDQDKQSGKTLPTTIELSEKDSNTPKQLVESEFNQELFIAGVGTGRETGDIYRAFLHACNQYYFHARDLKQINDQQRLLILKTARIVGMTTTGCAIYQDLIRALAPRVVFVEEAAEILEPQLLACITDSVEQIVLIGDHEQLQPNISYHLLGVRNKFNVSLFERLVNNGKQRSPGVHIPHVTLEQQRRMRPEIASLVQHIYPTLRNHETVFGRTFKVKRLTRDTNKQEDIEVENIPGVYQNIYFVDHSCLESATTKHNSLTNPGEAKLLIQAALHLVRNGLYPSSLTLLSTYRGQSLLLRELCRRNSTLIGVKVHTVDGYQGDENDCVLISLVRNNPSGSLGFLHKRNRICVTLSRARFGCYLFGNASLLRTSASWQPVLARFELHHAIGPLFPFGRKNLSRKANIGDFIQDPPHFLHNSRPAKAKPSKAKKAPNKPPAKTHTSLTYAKPTTKINS